MNARRLQSLSLWITVKVDYKLVVIRLFATKLIPTNVSQNLYSSLDFLSHFKNGIINRVFKCSMFIFYTIMFYFIKIKTTGLYRVILLRYDQIII